MRIACLLGVHRWHHYYENWVERRRCTRYGCSADQSVTRGAPPGWRPR